MSIILINGLKSKTGGGKVILDDYLSLLKKSNTKNRFIVLSPDKNEYEKYSCDFIKIIDIKNLYKKNLFFPLLYYFVLPKLLKDHRIDLIFNLGDILIPTDIPQVYLFDWPYAIYTDSVVWKRMDIKSYLSRKVKLFMFGKSLKYATTVIAQTKNVKDRLESIYGINNIKIIPNAIPLSNMPGRGESFNFNLPKNKIKLLYLTYYYPHKNLEVFLPLAKSIKDLSLPYCIVITIESKQHKLAKKFIDSIKKENLQNVIINIGPVKIDSTPSLYSQIDALLMPTLLESFGLPYIETMNHKKTILTSDLDFAHEICGEAAFYFNPLSVDSILSSIRLAFKDNNMRIEKIKKGEEILRKLPTWEEVFDKYQELLDK